MDFVHNYGTIILISAVTSLGLILYVKRSSEKSIPGPRGLPFLGNILQFRRTDRILLENTWANKYGDIVLMKLGSFSYININSVELVKEIFIENSKFTSGRPHIELMDKIKVGKYGIIMTEGEYWKNVRKYFSTSFTTSNQTKRLQEIACRICKSAIGEFFQLADSHQLTDGMGLFTKRVNFKIISKIAFGAVPLDEHFEQEIINVVEELFKIVGDKQIHDFIPIIPYPKKYLKQIESFMERRNKLLNKVIDLHKEKLDPTNPTDFLDILLANMDSEKWVTEDLLGVLINIFQAGIDTSAHSTTWFIAYMIKFPEIQKKFKLN